VASSKALLNKRWFYLFIGEKKTNVGFFIASSREKILVGNNCFAFFYFFLRRLCIGVTLIDTFSVSLSTFATK